MKQNADLFTAKYKELYLDMYRFALYTLKNPHDAEDVVSDTVLDAWKSIHLLRNDDAFRAWIFRILTNKCKKKLKSYIDPAVSLPEELPSPEENSGILLDVRNAFMKLDDEERLIISLHLFAGYKTREIAKMLHKNENSVRSRQSRALKKMEQMLTV